jgi:hypothetical protein
MLNSVTFGNFISDNGFNSPPNNFNRKGFISVTRFGSKSDLVGFRVKNPQISKTVIVIRSSQKGNEEGLRVVLATDTEGVVRSLAVVHGEDCPTGGEELGVLNFVHRENILKEPPEFVKRFP